MEINQFYYDGPVPTRDRIKYIETTQSPLFRIGQGFDTYKFDSPLADSFSDLIHERAIQIRKKYPYIRLWFTGGKDSRLVFDAFVKYNIHIDEIVIARSCPLGKDVVFNSVPEFNHNAIAFLEQRRDLIPKTKITLIDYTDEVYDSVYRNPDWIHHCNVFIFHSGYFLNLFYQYVNPEFGFVESLKSGEYCDLTGPAIPHVYWEGQWKFLFTDYQLFQLSENQENFLISNDLPEFTHAYVRDVSRKLDSMGIKLAKFKSEISDSQVPGNGTRNIKNLLPEYDSIVIPRPDLEMPKFIHDPWRPTEDFYWKVNSTYKSFLSCLQCYQCTPWPKSFHSYVTKTDWAAVKRSVDFNGILTQEYPIG